MGPIKAALESSVRYMAASSLMAAATRAKPPIGTVTDRVVPAASAARHTASSRKCHLDGVR
jgi:enoyl-[acyl-carrier-protein] reductase (NADH)